MDNQNERVRFLAKLPPALHRQLKVAAAQHDMSMNDLLVWVLRHHLHQLETGKEEIQR
jgi:predicted HicB family RNase H-like nuclease